MANKLFRILGCWSARVLAVGAIVTAMLLMAPRTSLDDNSAQAAASTGRGESASFNLKPGVLVQATFSATVPNPTAAELEELNRALANVHPAPALPPQPKVSNPPANPELRAPRQEEAGLAPGAPLSPGSLVVFRNAPLTLSGLPINDGFGYNMEPSTGASGKNIFETGNWFAARSLDNGATWSYLNPRSMFQDQTVSGFCCDQVTLYDASRNTQFWVLMYHNGLKLALSHASNPFSNWCYYNITPATIGQPAVSELDYGDLAIGAKYLYLTSNVFLTSGTGSMILRMPIDSLLKCGSLTGNSIVRADSYTFKPVQGSDDVMYWGSNWTDLPIGSSMRLFAWPENSSSYWWYDRTGLPTWTFFRVSGGQNCGSLSGTTVKNWCQSGDSRVLGGALIRTPVGSAPSIPTPELYFSFNAMQDGTHPFPYTRIFRFSESDKTFTGQAEQWASWAAIQYTSLSPNSRGDLGFVFAFGGQAVGGAAYYPSAGIAVQDDYTPSPPWSTAYVQFGAGNTCTFRGRYIWGDYLTVRPYYPVGDVWVGAIFATKKGDCGTPGAIAQGRNIVFGRGRDAGSYNRWSSQ